MFKCIKHIAFFLLLAVLILTVPGCESYVLSTPTSTIASPQSTTPITTPGNTSTPLPPTTTVSPVPSSTTSTATQAPSPIDSNQELEVHFIDVGQGDAILIDQGETEVLIDGGEKSPGVVSYLKDYVDGPLEVMVATHPHADHIGGLIDVLAAYDVEQIWYNGEASTSKTYSDFMSAVNSENAEVHVGKRGDVIQVGGLAFQVLNPKDLNSTTNNNSIVLYLKYGQVGFLFEGDAEKEGEGSMLVASDIPLPDIDILKVGHHGSRTASSPDFLSDTKPEVAVYMAGVGNSYGHPHQETIQALTAIGAEIFGTDVNGTITITTDSKEYEVHPEKQSSSSRATQLTQPATESTDNLTENIEQNPVSDNIIYRDYAWNYQGEWTWECAIPQALYDYYRELPRPPTTDYSVYVTHPLDDLYIDRLVEKLQNAAEESQFSAYETVEFAAAFVQSLPYTMDSVTTPNDEYPRYPVETLVDNGGDCEDTSILLASIIHEMGYGVVLIILPNHCAIGVKGGDNVYGTYYDFEGSKYYYMETTGEGWEIGDFPEEYEGVKASIYPLVPTPILTHEWEFTGTQGYYLILEVKVQNLGTAPADDVFVEAGFDAGNDKWWNSEQSDIMQIDAGWEYTVKLYLKVPLNEHTRLLVHIVMDGYTVDDSYSKWFDT
jgi:beta-lactamase superfamily II metal-dependent hydrolase